MRLSYARWNTRQSSRWKQLGFTAVLLPLVLLVRLAGAQPTPPQPAQVATRVHLPLLILPEPPAPLGAPVIDSFTISSAAGPMAAEVELRWRVRNATSLTIEPNVGDVRGGASAQIYPLATSTYTLTASNAKGSVTTAVTYTVNALPTPNPLTVAATSDDARAVAAEIGAAGGMLETTGADGTRYTLSVPPEALLYTEAITLTPVAAIAGLPFTASAVRAVSIAPEGLLFIEPATLTITPPVATTAPRTVGFAFQGVGSEFHLRRLESATALTVVTARSYGVALTPGGNALAAARAFPSDRMDALAHLLATTPGERIARGVAMVPQQSNSDDDLLAPLVDAAYVLDVRPELQNAVQNPDRVDLAAQMYISWRSLNRDNGNISRNHISEANLLLGEALRKAGELATERCNAQRPAQGFALQRYIGYAKRFGLVNTRAALEERLKKCWKFQLEFKSHINEFGPGFEYDFKLAASIPLNYDSSASRMVGSGPLAWVELAWSGEEGCTFSLTGEDSMLDAASGVRGLSLAPVSQSSPEVRVSFTYDPGTPAENVTIACPPPTSPINARTTAWHAYFKIMHATERQDGSFIATKQANISADFPRWDYNNTTTGPSGQTAVENTTITLKHTPTS